VLITEAVNRRRQLAMGRVVARPKGHGWTLAGSLTRGWST
jgi:hypothetical protein